MLNLSPNPISLPDRAERQAGRTEEEEKSQICPEPPHHTQGAWLAASPELVGPSHELTMQIA